MDDLFKIYIDRLAGGKVEEICSKISPSFLKVDDGKLLFNTPVSLNGRAYLADEHLVIHMDVEMEYETNCKICNKLIKIPFKATGLYLTEDISNARGKIFDYEGSLRDSILLEIPMYAECENDCPERKELQQYLRS